MKRLEVITLSKIWLTISGVLVAGSVIAMIAFGLNLGIDFTGGSLLEMRVDADPSVQEVREALSAIELDATVQESGEDGYLMRFETVTPERYEEIVGALSEQYEGFEELRFESIGPVIGSELKRKSVMAVVILLVLIISYVAWTFRKVSKPVASWKYGLLTIVAATHDIIIPLGVFAVLGQFAGFEITTATVAALLTILGYSINDTIVVFDRTRENLLNSRHSDEAFGDIVNRSVQESFARSINTSVTTLLVLLAIYFFGGDTTQSFILTLIIGIIAGAYSSIFLASPLLVLWEKRSK